MTADHLFFSLATTGYTFLGILSEERDLLKFYGEVCRDYRKKVAMIFPFPKKG